MGRDDGGVSGGDARMESGLLSALGSPYVDASPIRFHGSLARSSSIAILIQS